MSVLAAVLAAGLLLADVGVEPAPPRPWSLEEPAGPAETPVDPACPLPLQPNCGEPNGAGGWEPDPPSPEPSPGAECPLPLEPNCGEANGAGDWEPGLQPEAALPTPQPTKPSALGPIGLTSAVTDERAVMINESPTWATEIDAWSTALRAAGRSEQTIGLRRYHLERLARWAGERDPWCLLLDDLLTWTGEQAWRAETRRSCRASLRAFWRWGVLTGRVAVDIAMDLPSVPPAKPTPRPAPPEAVQVALGEAERRVWLMLRMATEVGMRRGEVAQVHTDDLTRDLAGWSLHVHGKGSRDRVVPLPDSLARALREEPEGFLFPGNDHGHLSARWVGRLVGRMLPVGVTMHQLRHLCATELHDQTHDLRAIQELLGHASVATTQRYVAVRSDAVRAMVAERSARWAA